MSEYIYIAKVGKHFIHRIEGTKYIIHGQTFHGGISSITTTEQVEDAKIINELDIPALRAVVPDVELIKLGLGPIARAHNNSHITESEGE